MEEIMQDIKVLFKEFDELNKKKDEFNKKTEELKGLESQRSVHLKIAENSKKDEETILENMKLGIFDKDTSNNIENSRRTQQEEIKRANQIPVEDKKQELEELEKEISVEIVDFRKEALEKFEELKELYIYRQKFEEMKQGIEQLKSSRNACIRVAQNDRKTMDKINEQLRLGNVDATKYHNIYKLAENSQQENLKKAYNISEEIKEKENILSKYKIIEDNTMEYLALENEIKQIQNLNFYNMQTSQIGNFIKEYEKVNSENEEESTQLGDSSNENTSEEPPKQGGQGTNQTTGRDSNMGGTQGVQGRTGSQQAQETTQGDQDQTGSQQAQGTTQEGSSTKGTEQEKRMKELYDAYENGEGIDVTELKNLLSNLPIDRQQYWKDIWKDYVENSVKELITDFKSGKIIDTDLLEDLISILPEDRKLYWEKELEKLNSNENTFEEPPKQGGQGTKQTTGRDSNMGGTQGVQGRTGSQQAQETTQGDQAQKGSPQGDRTKGTEQNQQSNTQNEHKIDPNIEKELKDKMKNIESLFQSAMEEEIELDEFEERRKNFIEELKNLNDCINQNQIPDEEKKKINDKLGLYKAMIQERNKTFPKQDIETQINYVRERIKDVRNILSDIDYEEGKTEEEKVRNWFRANVDYCSVDEYVKKLMEDYEKAKDLRYGENKKYLTEKGGRQFKDIYMPIEEIKNLADKIKNAHTKKVILGNGIYLDELGENIRKVKYKRKDMKKIFKGKDNIIDVVYMLYELKGGAITEDFEKILYSNKDRLNPYILKAMQESSKFTKEDVDSYIKAIKDNQAPKTFKIIYDQEKYNKKRSVGDKIKSFFGIGLTEKEADWMNKFALKDSENKIATIGTPKDLPAKISKFSKFKTSLKRIGSKLDETMQRNIGKVKDDKVEKEIIDDEGFGVEDTQNDDVR